MTTENKPNLGWVQDDRDIEARERLCSGRDWWEHALPNSELARPSDATPPSAPSPTVAGLSDETALRVALEIMQKLDDRSGVLDDVDDEIRHEIADEIAVVIKTQVFPSDSAETRPVGHFVRRSMFGPWIEIDPAKESGIPLYAAPAATRMPQLNDAMRGVLRNENCVYGSEDELYAALCAAAPAATQPVNPYGSRGTSLGEAWHRGYNGERMLGAPGSTYEKAWKEGRAARPIERDRSTGEKE